MTRKFSILVIIALFVTAMVGAQAFGATVAATHGKQVTGNANLPAYAHGNWRAGGVDDPYAQALGVPVKPQQPLYNSSLGFDVVGSVISTGLTTQYDLTANNTLPTTIDYALSCSGSPYVVGLYMDQQPAATRFVGAYSYSGSGGVNTGVGSASGGGFPCENATPGGLGFGVWHVVSAGGTQAAEDLGCGINAYSAANYPTTNNLGYVSGPSEGAYIWPSLAMDNPSGGGGYVAHIVSHESPNTGDASGYQTMVYYKSAAGSPNPGVANAIVIDSVSLIAGCVAQDPNSDNVAIVYGKPRVYTDTLFANDDVVYVKSTNNGTTWSSQQMIHHFVDDSTNTIVGSSGDNFFERAWETTALYSSDGCLHVAFVTTWSDTGTSAGVFGDGGFILIFPSRILHWTDCNPGGVTVVADASGYGGCSGGLGGVAYRNVSKVNLAECSSTNNLYAVYNKSYSGEDGVTLDCSAAGFTNFDIALKASSTGGLTWGNEINVTATSSNSCAAGACFDELSLGAVRYNTDSLRIAYLEDKDAGVNINTNGAATNSPIKNVAIQCFNMSTFVDLSANPAEYLYPFHTTPGVATATQTSIVQNLGNTPATPNVNVSYTSGSGWLNITSGATLNVPVGFANTNNLTFTATGPATQGLYQAVIQLPYDDGTAAAPVTLEIPVDLYDFTTFCLPEDQLIRTGLTRLAVNQASEVSNAVTGSDYYYFGDSLSYLFDGFLVMGNSAANLTYSTYGGGGNVSLPTVSNPFGFLWAKDCTTTYDSSTFAGYRVASGHGVNRDTTLEFKASYYANKLPGDNLAEFYVLRFDIYAGPNFSGTINNLNIGYYADWDVPSDTGSDNRSAVNAAKFALLQQGSYTQTSRWAAIAGYSKTAGAKAGKVFDNPTYIYPESGFENDSLWNWLRSGGALADGSFKASDSLDNDLSALIVTHRGASIGATDTVSLIVILATEDNDMGAGSADVLATLDDAKSFVCTNSLAPDFFFCSACMCGDADGSGGFSIGDAVYIINYIFGGGPAPSPLCHGDADGSGGVSIGDAVYLINFIFGGGPAPHCP